MIHRLEHEQECHPLERDEEQVEQPAAVPRAVPRWDVVARRASSSCVTTRGDDSRCTETRKPVASESSWASRGWILVGAQAIAIGLVVQLEPFLHGLHHGFCGLQLEIRAFVFVLQVWKVIASGGAESIPVGMVGLQPDDVGFFLAALVIPPHR